MSLDRDKTTVDFGDESDVEYLEELEHEIPANWTQVDNAQAFECDLQEGMCSLIIERVGEGWVGKLSSANPPTHEKTAKRHDLKAAVLQLRVLIRDHGLLLKKKGSTLIDIASDNYEPSEQD